MAKYRGTDAVWKRATDATFTTLATITNMRELSSPLGGRLSQFDQSAYGDVWMDFGGGQKEGNEVTLIMQYDPANTAQANMITDADNGATMYIQTEHTPMARKVRTTMTGLGAEYNFDRTGSAEVHITGKIVNPGSVSSALP